MKKKKGIVCIEGKKGQKIKCWKRGGKKNGSNKR